MIFKIPKSLPKFLSEEEIKILLDKGTYKDSSYKGLRMSTMLEILYATLILRISELIKIKKGDINDDLSSILIKGKGGFRVVPLFDKAIVTLKIFEVKRKLNLEILFLFPSSSKDRSYYKT